MLDILSRPKTLIHATQYPESPLPHTMSSSHSNQSQDPNRGSASSNIETSTNTTITKKSRSSRPADANFRQKLIDSRVYPYGYKYPNGDRPPLPPEWEKINQRLTQPRPSLSPSTFPDKEYQEFIDKDAEAHNEDAVKDSVLPAMLRAMKASDSAQKNILFTNVDPISDGITQAKPDYYSGAPTETILPEVRKKLDNIIVPSGHTHLPAAPNLFMEAKGPRGDQTEALLQACHDGAIGARAMQSLQAYGQETPVYDNMARTISTIYHGGTLKMYAHSVGQPNGLGTEPEYYMHQMGTWGMTDNSDRNTFLRGATAFKNALDMTRECRDEAISSANETARQKTQEHGDVPANGEEQQGPQEADGDEDGSDDAEDDEEEEEGQDVAESSFMVSTPTEHADHESETSMEDGIYRATAKRVSKRPLIGSPHSSRSIRSGSRRRVGTS